MDLGMSKYDPEFVTNHMLVPMLLPYRSLRHFCLNRLNSLLRIRRIFNFPEIQCITLSDGTIANKNPLEKFIAMFWDDVGTVFDNDGGFKVHTFKGDELKNKKNTCTDFIPYEPLV